MSTELPHAENQIIQGIRMIAAAGIRDDGSRGVQQRDEALVAFLKAQMLAIARFLYGMQLTSEPPLKWQHKPTELHFATTNRIIHGISILEREPHYWAGWTDADMHVDGERYRIFVPICPKPDDAITIESFTPEQVRRLIVPQLARLVMSKQPNFATIRRLLFEPWSKFSAGIVLRNEVFIDSETFSDHPAAKQNIVKLAADRIVSRIKDLSAKEQSREMFRLAHSIEPVMMEVVRLAKAELSTG